MVGLIVHSADIQDRDGTAAALKTILGPWPWLRHIFADGGYAGPKLRAELGKFAKFTVQNVKQTDKTKGFEVLPRRWVVERTFARLGRCRRLAKDREKSIASAEAWMLVAHIRILTRRLARYHVY
ncbi:transposase [Rhizobium sp. BE258]|nr:transposase [Rhizobium sp. BE258]